MSDSEVETSLELKAMSVQELGAWLKENGIPESFCGIFEGISAR